VNELLTSLDLIGAESDLKTYNLKGKKIIWGLAPTGRMHAGYLAILLLLKKLQMDGAEIIILLANYHGYLDSTKAQWNALSKKTNEYKQDLKAINLAGTIEAKDFYGKPEYIEKLFFLSEHCQVKKILEAGIGTLKKRVEEANASSVIYVLTQILDIGYLESDIVVCGLDESPVYRLGIPIMDKYMNWNSNYIYMPMVPGITELEMHASDSRSNKINLIDTQKKILEKLNSQHRKEFGHVPLIDHYNNVLVPLAHLIGIRAKIIEHKKNNLEYNLELLSIYIKDLIDQVKNE